jgi:hypothetical protein
MMTNGQRLIWPLKQLTVLNKPKGNKMKVILKNVRLSFPELFTAGQFQGQGPKSYSATFIVQPGSEADQAITAAIESVAKEKWLAKAPAILKNFESKSKCYVSGDLKAYDGYEGNMILTAKKSEEKGRPVVIGRDKQPLTEADGKPYAGCYVNAQVDVWAQDNQFGKGVRATLVAVQFWANGDAFGSGSASADFDAFEAGDEDDLT